MKKYLLTSILALLVAGASAVPQDYPDEYLGLPGDNLNLYAVMKLFQESETLEGFERNLNAENSRINNLDLNGDDLIDYITVHDYVDGDVHTIVLRVALNRNEFQDVAVFTVQKFRDGSVQIQLVGDEDLYGKNYIIEPIYDETPNPGYTGNRSRRTTVTIVRTTPYEVAMWPVVRYIYLPNYVVWRSSWYWGYYPPYWNPWRPYYWHYYYGYHYHWYHHYYNHYRHWDYHRYARYNDYYYRSVRAHSPYVSQRIREGQFRNTYSRPEQRREGEALYTRSYPNQARRTAENTPVVRERRTSVQNGDQRNASEGTVRRQATTESQRPASRSASDANTGSARRTAPAAGERPANRSSSEQKSATERRSAPAVSNRPESRSSTQQNTATERKSVPAANERPVNRSSSQQNASPERRSVPAASDRPVTRSSSQQNAPAAGRRTSSASERSASRSSQSARSQSSSGSRQKEVTMQQSRNRNTGETRPAQSSRKSEEKKESSGNSSRRK